MRIGTSSGIRFGRGGSGIGSVNGTGPIVNPNSRWAQVSSRISIPTTLHATATQIMSRTGHQNPTEVTALRIGFPNWCVLTGGSGEAGSGGNATFEASIEYPAGVYTRVTFNASNQGVAINNSTIISDTTYVSIPANTDYWVKVYAVFANKIVHTFKIGAAYGDMGTAGTSVTNNVMASQTNGSSLILPPCLIIANHTMPAVLALGDSRVYGTGATTDSSIKSEICLSLHGYLPYINAGRHGINFSTITGSLSARRKELAAWCSDVIFQGGINDITGGTSDATFRTQLNTGRTNLLTYAPNARVSLSTLAPVASSVDSWTTVAGQTTVASNPVRVTHNDWRRTVPTGFYRCFEVADAVESSRNSGLWKTDELTPFFTAADSTHESDGGFAAIVSSGAINPASFSYP